MNRYLSFALLSCFLLSIIYEWFIPTWDGYYFSKLLIIGTLSGILWYKLSYAELMLKSVALIVFLDAVWNVGQFFMDGAYQGSFELLNAFIFVPWFAWALQRSYEAKSVPIVDGKVYWIAHKPDDLKSFLPSLFGGPVGGLSIYMDSMLYGYHKGVFKGRSIDLSKLNVVAIESSLMVSHELTQELSRMKGRKWSLFNNCLTMRVQLWSHYVR